MTMGRHSCQCRCGIYVCMIGTVIGSSLIAASIYIMKMQFQRKLLHISLFLTGIAVISISSCMWPCRCTNRSKKKGITKQSSLPESSAMWVPRNIPPPAKRHHELEPQNSYQGNQSLYSDISYGNQSNISHGNQSQRSMSSSSDHGNYRILPSTVQADVSVLNSDTDMLETDLKVIIPNMIKRESLGPHIYISSEMEPLQGIPMKHMRSSSYCSAVSPQYKYQLSPPGNITPPPPKITVGGKKESSSNWNNKFRRSASADMYEGDRTQQMSLAPPSYEDFMRMQTEI